MHVPPSGRGSGAARRLTPRSVRSRQRGFELTAGLGQSTLCSASNPCPLTYHFVSRPPTRASMAPFGLSSSYFVSCVSLCVCFVFLYVCDVYVCLICENPGIDVVLTRAVSLLWSVGDRHRRVAVRRSLSIQGHTCKAPFGVHDIDLSSTTVRSTFIKTLMVSASHLRSLPLATGPSTCAY